METGTLRITARALYIDSQVAYKAKVRENKREYFMRHTLKLSGLYIFGVIVGLLALLALTPRVFAATCATNPDQQTCSSNYGVSETFFGSGGDLNTCSASYCSKQSAGELTVGNTSGTNFQAQAGFNTDRTPWISAAVITPLVDLGLLSNSTTNSGTAQFKVSAYLTNGYVVQLYGTPPSNSGHVLAAMTGGASAVGTEQFGINLTTNNVATTTPNVFGSDPVQDPNYPAQPFGFGQAAAGYNTANSFKFNSGDVIATSAKSSSYTIFTIAYIANISAVTPGGVYTGYNSIVATGTY